MGGKCSPSGGINPVSGRTLEINGTPNSRSDLYNESDELIQSRWYDQDGLSMWDRDFKHSNPFHDHEFPHDHKWDWKWNSKKGEYEPVRSKPLSVDDYNFC